jgi:hypothetical protein
MAPKMHSPTGQAGEEHSGPDTDCGPSIVRLAVARLLVLTVAVVAVHLGLKEWHTATFAVLVLGAAWMFGRVD